MLVADSPDDINAKDSSWVCPLVHERVRECWNACNQQLAAVDNLDSVMTLYIRTARDRSNDDDDGDAAADDDDGPNPVSSRVQHFRYECLNGLNHFSRLTRELMMMMMMMMMRKTLTHL